MKIIKKNKIRWLVGLVLVVILFVLFIMNPLLIKYKMSAVAKKIGSKDYKTYRIINSNVYGMDLGKKKYDNLISHGGVGTGEVVIEKEGYSYAISLGIFCYKKEINNKYDIEIGKCNAKLYNFIAQEAEQIFIAPRDGTYQFELWGAGGGNAHALGFKFDKGGKGAYVSGNIALKKGEVLHVYVGSRGEDGEIIEDRNRLTSFYYPSTGGLGGYNGGGKGFDDPQTDAGGGGGGATDIRVNSGKWNDFLSLKSRIMIAGGGGGSSRFYTHEDVLYERGAAGSGGTISGNDALKLIEKQKENGHGSTQTTGYKFGIGENGGLCMTSANGAGGGAGGYFGSKSGACGIDFFEMPTGAGGASSYVSGCKGCNAIDKNSTENSIKFTNQPIHYSGKKFTNIIMKSGDEKMPNPFGGTMTGNRDDGHARITFIK